MSNEMNQQTRGRIVIRIGRHHLSFSSVDLTHTESSVTYEPYVVKSNMSMAANLREALKGAALGQAGVVRATVMVDAPVLLTPVEVFEESKMGEMYRHAFPHRVQEQVLYNVLPDLNAVAVFSLNKDLKLVLDDNFADIRLMAAMTPVWRHLHRRSFTGARGKLYGYFHDRQLDIFAFQQNRFKFQNQFAVSRQKDAVYFLLYVWKQLMLDARHDELHLMGEFPDGGEGLLADELRRYLQNVYVVNPSAEFSRAPATKVEGMPFDLVTLLTKGR